MQLDLHKEYPIFREVGWDRTRIADRCELTPIVSSARTRTAAVDLLDAMLKLKKATDAALKMLAKSLVNVEGEADL